MAPCLLVTKSSPPSGGSEKYCSIDFYCFTLQEDADGPGGRQLGRCQIGRGIEHHHRSYLSSWFFFWSALVSDVLRSFSYYDHGPLGMKPGVLMSKEKYLLLTSQAEVFA